MPLLVRTREWILLYGNFIRPCHVFIFAIGQKGGAKYMTHTGEFIDQ